MRRTTPRSGPRREEAALLLGDLQANLITIGVGAGATALLGGVVAPVAKGVIDRRRERYTSAVELVDTLALDLWSYWKLALRIAYYGEQGKRGRAGYEEALAKWQQ